MTKASSIPIRARVNNCVASVAKSESTSNVAEVPGTVTVLAPCFEVDATLDGPKGCHGLFNLFK
jgi:hypothetical protein